MQDVKAAALYKSFCEQIEKDNRLQRDLKRHNWLLMKLNKKLYNSDGSTGKSAKMKPSSPLQRTKSAPKLRPTLPVCLPLSYHHKFLKNTESQENGHLIEHTEKTSVISFIKKKPILGTSNIIRQENNNFSKLEKTVENFTRNNDTELIHEDKSTDTLDLDNVPAQSVIHINVEFDKKLIPVKEVSVQVPETTNHDQKDLTKNKIDVTNIPLPYPEKFCQTEEVTVIYGEDVDLLRTVKRFNFTIEDLEQFNQITIQNNNNYADFENQNELIIDLDEDKNESINSEQVVSENDDSKSTEQSDNSNNQKNYDNPILNQNEQIIKSQNQSSSLATGLFERLKLWSDLNKVILRTFYEGILLGKEKGHDNVSMENYLSQHSQHLVDEICDMVTNYSENYGTNISRVVEIIELDDCEDQDDLLRKQPPQSDKNTTDQIDVTKKTQADAQQHQDYALKDVSQNIVIQNQETQYEIDPILETQNLIIPYQESGQANQNEVNLNQITQYHGNRFEETRIHPMQYQGTPYHASNIQMNQNQVTHKAENHSILNTVAPTRTMRLNENDTQTLRNVLMPVNEVGRLHNQIQNVAPIYQGTAAHTEIIPQRSTVLRESRMNSMPSLPIDRSNRSDSRLPNYYNSQRDKPLENTFYGNTKNIRKQQNFKAVPPFRSQPHATWYQKNRFHDSYPNIQTPTNTSYQAGHRAFQNVMKQNPQYNSPANNYQNIHQYHNRNSYGRYYRRW